MHPTIDRLGILGGTFDPFHNGHLRIAEAAATDLGLDRVLIVPAGSPWQRRDFSSAEDRLLMAILATAAEPRCQVSRMELDRRGPTFTVDTLRELHSFYGDAELHFLIGADSLALLPTWVGFEELKDLATFVVVERPGYDMDLSVADDRWPPLRALNMKPVDISATQVRERVRLQQPIGDLVPADVERYIAANGLYVGSKELGHV